MEIDVVRQQQRMDHDAIGRCHLWSPKKTCSQCKKKPERVETITTTRERWLGE
jgi:hypothetical protein